MKPQDLKYPFAWEERRPLLDRGVLFVPRYYFLHRCPVLFDRVAPIHLEYCSGHGHWIVERAKKHPAYNWIAVEKRFERVRKIWSKKCNEQVDNLLIVHGDAETFTEFYLSDDSVDHMYINFPDPWPKTKHAHHRLFKQPFIGQMARALKKGGISTMVTDDALWAERIHEAMENSWQPVFPPPFYVTEWENYGSSYFDALWRKQGRTIHYLQFQPSAV